MRYWMKQRAPGMHPLVLTRRRGWRLVVLVSVLPVPGLMLAGRPRIEADATCSVPPVNPTSALNPDGTAVVLNWVASPDCTPDEHALYRRDMDVEGSRMTKIDTVDGDVLSYTDTTVNAGEVYRYRIRSNELGSPSDRTEIAIPEATVSEPGSPSSKSTSPSQSQGESSRKWIAAH